MSALLNQLYYNPKIGFESEDKLYVKAYEINDNITHEDVEEFMDEQTVPQITKPLDREVEFDSIESPSVKNNYEMDIMFYLVQHLIITINIYLLVLISIHVTVSLNP